MEEQNDNSALALSGFVTGVAMVTDACHMDYCNGNSWIPAGTLAYIAATFGGVVGAATNVMIAEITPKKLRLLNYLVPAVISGISVGSMVYRHKHRQNKYIGY